MPVPREFIEASYRALLGREPENDFVVEQAMLVETPEDYLREVLSCAEFRATHPSLVPQSSSWVWAEPAGDFILKVNLADNAIAWPSIENQFEPAETAFMRRNVVPGLFAADVGANVGYFTMLLATLVGKLGHVYSFEPIYMVYEPLLQSVKRNDYENIVTTSNCALSDVSGTINMISATETDNWGGSQFSTGKFEGSTHSSTEVKTIRLDDLGLTKLDFMKIDVEGAEPKVIAGGRKTLENFRPVILTEVHPEALEVVSRFSPAAYLTLLYDLGYKGYRLNPDGTVGKDVDPSGINSLMNVLLIPSEFETVCDRFAAAS